MNILTAAGLGLATLTAVSAFAIAPASAQECPIDRPVNMAGLGYESHAFHTEVVATIMREGYGCEVEIIPVETLAGFTGLARGDLDANMEIWTANPPPAWQEGLDSGTLVDLGPNFPAALEGWFVPRYLVEGPDAPAPDLRTPQDLARYAELFADPEDPDKGRFYNCVAGWVCEEINTRKLEVYGLTDLYTNFRPGSGGAMAADIVSRVHRDTLGRIDVPVGVGYDSDPVKVKEILLEVANAHPMTLSYPEPAAFFVEFGASSLDFMLFAYLADVGNGYGVRSDLRFEIFRRFQEEGIEIPFAQSDVSIRNLDQILEVLSKAGATLPEGLGAGGLSGDEAIKQIGVSTVPAPEPKVSTAAELRSGRMIDPDGDGVPSDDNGPDDGPMDRG